MNTSTNRRRLAVAALAGSLALASVACGGSKQSTPAPEASTTTPSTTVAPITAAPTTAAPTTTVLPTTVFSPDSSIKETVKDLIDKDWMSRLGATSFNAIARPFTGLLEQIGGPGPVTLFLPGPIAWGFFLAVTGRDEQKTFEDQELMSEVLSYLVVTDRKYTPADLLKMDGQEITTAAGKALKVIVRNGGVYFASANPLADSRFSRGLTRVTLGVPAKNGYIYSLDWVPLPREETLKLITCDVGRFGCDDYPNPPDETPGFCVPGNITDRCVSITEAPTPEVPTTTAVTETTVLPDLCCMETVWDILNWEGQPLGWLVDAIKAVGLEDLLKGPGPVTLLAPTAPEAFFKALGITGKEVLQNKELLTKIIDYLVVTGPNRYLAEDLFKMDGQSLTTLGGAKLPITVKYGVAYVPGNNPYGDVSMGGPLSAIYGSVHAKNGAVLYIDWVPLPPDVKFIDLLKCPSGRFGCDRKASLPDGLFPGFCDAKKSIYGCYPLSKD